MKQANGRRAWLKKTALLAAGAASAPWLTTASAKAPVRPYRRIRTIEQDMIAPPEIPTLRARLLANENPYGPSKAATKAIAEAIASGNRYPFRQGATLQNLISERESIPAEQILMGPGSTQLLDHAALHIAGTGTILCGTPSYLTLIETAENQGGSTRAIPMKADFSYDLAAMEAALDDSVSLVYICNPNNPTGTMNDTEALRDFVRRVSDRVTVFVDEAYLDFLPNAMAHSMVDLVREGKDVIVSRTFSKIFGLAGMRIGYLCAPAETAEALGRLTHVQWDISGPALAAATASITDPDFMTYCRSKNQEAREYLYEILDAEGFEYLPSATNFVLFPLRMRTEPFQNAMFAEGIGIRVYDINRRPYCRVSMGTMEEMALFRESFLKVVG